MIKPILEIAWGGFLIYLGIILQNKIDVENNILAMKIVPWMVMGFGVLIILGVLISLCIPNKKNNENEGQK